MLAYNDVYEQHNSFEDKSRSIHPSIRRSPLAKRSFFRGSRKYSCAKSARTWGKIARPNALRLSCVSNARCAQSAKRASERARSRTATRNAKAGFVAVAARARFSLFGIFFRIKVGNWGKPGAKTEEEKEEESVASAKRRLCLPRARTESRKGERNEFSEGARGSIYRRNDELKKNRKWSYFSRSSSLFNMELMELIPFL